MSKRELVAREHGSLSRSRSGRFLEQPQTDTGYSAYVINLTGCVSVGRTREEMDRNIREALDELREQGAAIPTPSTNTEYILDLSASAAKSVAPQGGHRIDS